MKFAVVGQLTNLLPLLRQIHASADHQLTAAHLSGLLASALADTRIPIRRESTAEDTFLTQDVDAVVIAVDNVDQALQLVRSALQADRHVVVYAPPDASTAFGFELHLLFDDAQRSVIPMAGRMRFRDLPNGQLRLTTSPAADPAAVQQLDLELALPTNDRSLLRELQLQALDAVAATGLRYTQITALDATAPDGTFLSRRLTLGASATSEDALPPAMVTIRLRSSGATPAVLQLTNTDDSVHQFELDPDPSLLSRITYLCQSRDRCVPWLEAFSSSLELADAAEKSIRRRRTVDVYFDSGSERSVFKSYMTAIGCGVLMWMMLGMVGFLVIAKVANLPPAVLKIARVLWIAPVVIFLFVQFLLPITRSRGAKTGRQK